MSHGVALRLVPSAASTDGPDTELDELLEPEPAAWSTPHGSRAIAAEADEELVRSLEPDGDDDSSDGDEDSLFGDSGPQVRASQLRSANYRAEHSRMRAMRLVPARHHTPRSGRCWCVCASGVRRRRAGCGTGASGTPSRRPLRWSCWAWWCLPWWRSSRALSPAFSPRC